MKNNDLIDNYESMEIGFAIVSGLVWGALAARSFAMFFANVSGYPLWNIMGVFIVVSLIGCILTFCAFNVDVDTG